MLKINFFLIIELMKPRIEANLLILFNKSRLNEILILFFLLAIEKVDVFKTFLELYLK